ELGELPQCPELVLSSPSFEFPPHKTLKAQVRAPPVVLRVTGHLALQGTNESRVEWKDSVVTSDGGLDISQPSHGLAGNIHEHRRRCDVGNAEGDPSTCESGVLDSEDRITADTL